MSRECFGPYSWAADNNQANLEKHGWSFQSASIALEHGRPVPGNTRADGRDERIASLNGETIKVDSEQRGDETQIISAHRNSNLAREYDAKAAEHGVTKNTGDSADFAAWRRLDERQYRRAKPEFDIQREKQQDRATHLRAEANNHLNGAQSVHEVSVHVSVSRSAKNLALQYAFSPEQITVSVKEIWLVNDFTNTDTLPKEYNPVWLAPARRCVERLSLVDFIDQRSGISMPQAIAFVWAGINNRYAKGQNTTPLEIEEIISRRGINFLKTLYEIQREYNLSGGARPIDDGAADRPTCVSGSFNKLIAALNEQTRGRSAS